MPPGLRYRVTELLRGVSTPHLRAFIEGEGRLLDKAVSSSKFDGFAIRPGELLDRAGQRRAATKLRLDLRTTCPQVRGMDDDSDLAGSLLSRIVGMLEELASVAVLAETAKDAAAITAMQKNLADAAALLDAVSVRITRTTNGST